METIDDYIKDRSKRDPEFAVSCAVDAERERIKREVNVLVNSYLLSELRDDETKGLCKDISRIIDNQEAVNEE